MIMKILSPLIDFLIPRARMYLGEERRDMMSTKQSDVNVDDGLTASQQRAAEQAKIQAKLRLWLKNH